MVGIGWRINETYIKLNGKWVYLRTLLPTMLMLSGKVLGPTADAEQRSNSQAAFTCALTSIAQLLMICLAWFAILGLLLQVCGLDQFSSFTEPSSKKTNRNQSSQFA
jgi:hypothetical protein